MKLLFQRDQKAGSMFSLIPLRIGSGVIFTLHCQIELTEEENALLEKYKLSNAPLVVSDPIEDIKQSFRPAFLLGIISFIIGWLIFSFIAALWIGVIVTIVMTIKYFETLREQINVNDLTEGGRKFYCDSVVLLAKKEIFLTDVSRLLRQLIELAKTWGDRDIEEIDPLDKKEVRELLAKEL